MIKDLGSKLPLISRKSMRARLRERLSVYASGSSHGSASPEDVLKPAGRLDTVWTSTANGRPEISADDLPTAA